MWTRTSDIYSLFLPAYKKKILISLGTVCIASLSWDDQDFIGTSLHETWNSKFFIISIRIFFAVYSTQVSVAFMWDMRIDAFL